MYGPEYFICDGIGYDIIPIKIYLITSAVRYSKIAAEYTAAVAPTRP
jgi:hypothetical protein